MNYNILNEINNYVDLGESRLKFINKMSSGAHTFASAPGFSMDKQTRCKLGQYHLQLWKRKTKKIRSKLVQAATVAIWLINHVRPLTQ